MRKFIVILFAVALTFTTVAALSFSATRAGTDNDAAAIISVSDSTTDPASATPEDQAQSGKKRGGLGSFFGAPFNALGKLFRRGNRPGKPRRMTERDAKRFEGVGVMRVTDSRSPVAPASARSTASDALTQGGAAEALAAGRELLQNEFLNEAVAKLSLAASIDPKLAEAHSLLGIAYDRKGLRELARKSYERALRIAPDDAQTLNNLGYSFYLNGDYRRALERLKRSARLAPTDERILNNLALTQCRLGKYDEALENFTRAGGEFLARMNVASMLERAGRAPEAIPHYEAAHRLRPDAPVALRRLTALYLQIGQPDKARSLRPASATSAERATTTATTAGGN